MTTPSLYFALVHHPVLNKAGEVVTTSVTTFDIHDGARTGRTFGVTAAYYVTPIETQQGLLSYFKTYWTDGAGGARHASRKEALLRVEAMASIDAVIQDITEKEGMAPLVVATSARTIGDLPTWTMHLLKSEWKTRQLPLLVLFGTGWGLSPEAFEPCHAVLEPILGCDTYNHLPVRAAIAIYLDRLRNGS